MTRALLLALLLAGCGTIGGTRPGIVGPSRGEVEAIAHGQRQATAFTVPVVAGGMLATVFVVLLVQQGDEELAAAQAEREISQGVANGE